jgi:hypothetical protein
LCVLQKLFKWLNGQSLLTISSRGSIQHIPVHLVVELVELIILAKVFSRET